MASKPVSAVTPELLAAIQSQPNLPEQTWYLVAAVVLCVLNRPHEIPAVYTEAVRPAVDREERLFITRRMQEALIKASSICGMPKTINAMTALATATPDDLLDRSSPSLAATAGATSRSGDLCHLSSQHILHRGRLMFDRIYGKVAGRVLSQMQRSGTPDLSLTAQLAYGYVLSNTSILGPRDTSFVLVAGLVPQDVNPQLKGHLKGALNNGATVAETMAVRDLSIHICEAAGMRLLGEGDTDSWGWRSEIVRL